MNSQNHVTIITPAWNEEKNLLLLNTSLIKVFKNLEFTYEWIIIDDNSSDSTFSIIQSIASKNKNVKGVRLAKNYGSHTAIRVGLNIAQGKCAIVLASDLQDPPETIPNLLEKWKDKSQIVWAVRNDREGESLMTKTLSWLYYWIMKKVVGLKNIHSSGSDYFLIDRKVIDAVKLFKESNMSVFALISWLGFKQEKVYYTKQRRLYGRSGWDYRKKMRLLIDSITSFSHFPIRIMTYLGISIAFIGFLYACFVFTNALSGIPIPGWSSLIIVIALLGGFQLIMMGIMGEYLWRVLDESRRRPQYLIESATENSIIINN